MSDLDGEDAFDRVLERLIEATNSEKTMREQLSAAENSLRQERARADNAVRQVEASAESNKRDQPKLNALWNAADEFLKYTVLTPDSRLTTPDGIRSKLQDALTAANDACDGIPF